MGFARMEILDLMEEACKDLEEVPSCCSNQYSRTRGLTSSRFPCGIHEYIHHSRHIRPPMRGLGHKAKFTSAGLVYAVVQLAVSFRRYPRRGTRNLCENFAFQSHQSADAILVRCKIHRFAQHRYAYQKS